MSQRPVQPSQVRANVDIAGFTLSQPTSDQVLMRLVVNQDLTIPSGFTDSVAKSGIASTGTATYLIKRNGSTIGTITYTTSTTGVFADNTELTDHAFVVGDILTVVAPNSPDATHDELAWIIRGTHD